MSTGRKCSTHKKSHTSQSSSQKNRSCLSFSAPYPRSPLPKGLEMAFHMVQSYIHILWNMCIYEYLTYLNIDILLVTPGYYFDTLGNVFRGKKKGESCCYWEIPTPCQFSGRKITAFHQPSQIFCVIIKYNIFAWQVVPSFLLFGKLARARPHQWHGWMMSVFWVQLTSFAVLATDQSVVQCTDGLVGDFLWNMEKLSIGTVGQLQEFSWSLQIFTSTSEMHCGCSDYSWQKEIFSCSTWVERADKKSSSILKDLTPDTHTASLFIILFSFWRIWYSVLDKNVPWALLTHSFGFWITYPM